MSAKQVLIGDRRAAVRDRFVTALQGAGHRAVAVADAGDLIARVRSGEPSIDLLLLDVRMSGGAQLVRAIRGVDRGRTPILVFSGTVAHAGEARELQQVGVNGYINEHSAIHQILPALAPHLFPDSFNRRSSARVVLGIPVAYAIGETIARALTLNLGTGGLAIRAVTQLSPGTPISTRFRLPGATEEIHADARIVWNDRRGGMGLQFERLGFADQSSLQTFVDQHEQEPPP